MNEVDNKYLEVLNKIKESIQDSEHLQNYLEEEDESFYNALKEEFEPQIEELHLDVAKTEPLQLEALEEALLDPMLEGLFLPRILGYSVLRGAVNDDFKYIRPQEHFKKILLSICNSSNFDILKNRIGQTVEIGFALSSDIWISNLILEVSNKLVKSYLQGLKDPKYRDVRSRHTNYKRYSKQFKSFNYLTASLPTSNAEMKIEYRSVVNFLKYRASLGSAAGNSVYSYLKGIIDNERLGRSIEDLEILMLIGFHFDIQPDEHTVLSRRLGDYKDLEEEEESYFRALGKMQSESNGLGPEEFARMNGVISKSQSIIFKEFVATIHQIDNIGYLNPDAIDIARNYHNSNRGLSPQNDCLRNAIFNKFDSFLSVLSEDDFNEYFELNKVFTTYMNAFDNEQFNQNIKGISMIYVKKLLRRFTEKRSKDYQDIKKFVSAVFLDMGFMKEKEIKELFKTKRKRAVA